MTRVQSGPSARVGRLHRNRLSRHLCRRALGHAPGRAGSTALTRDALSLPNKPFLYLTIRIPDRHHIDWRQFADSGPPPTLIARTVFENRSTRSQSVMNL